MFNWLSKHVFCYPIGKSYWLVAGIAITLLMMVVLVGPGRTRVPFKRRLTLGLLRCAIILLIVFGMLRPTVVYVQTHKEDATLVLMIDSTRCMQVRDALNNKSRWDSLRATLDECAAVLRRHDRNAHGEFEIKVYTFDSETHPQEIKDGHIALPDVPAGQQTAIGAGLDDVLRHENGKRLLGIVLLTDGRQEALPPRDLPARTSPDRCGTRTIGSFRWFSASRADWAACRTWPWSISPPRRAVSSKPK